MLGIIGTCSVLCRLISIPVNTVFCSGHLCRVCVGIQVPPDANEDWYCRVCIAKKQEQAGAGDKKKKRKKKDKKDH